MQCVTVLSFYLKNLYLLQGSFSGPTGTPPSLALRLQPWAESAATSYSRTWRQGPGPMDSLWIIWKSESFGQMHGIELALSCFKPNMLPPLTVGRGKSHRSMLKDSGFHESTEALNNIGHQIFSDLCSVTIFRFKWVMNNWTVDWWLMLLLLPLDDV